MADSDHEIYAQLRASLEGKSASELADLCAELLLSYVVRRRPATAEQLGMMPVPKDMREMSFPQLIAWLQKQLFLPELQQLDVQGEVVSVVFGDRRIPIQVAAAQSSLPPAEPPAEQPPTPVPPTSTPAPARAAPKAASPDPFGAGRPAKGGEPASDRFSMLEID